MDKPRGQVIGTETGHDECGTDAPAEGRAVDEGQSAAKDAEMAEIAELQDAGIGVVICCGRRLRWRRERGSAVYETECGGCGTSYAMDRGYDYYEADEEDPGEAYGRFEERAS